MTVGHRTARIERLQLIAAALGLAVGGVLFALRLETPGRWVWAGVTGATLLISLIASARQLSRREVGIDLIAILAMGGALVVGEFLAGAIIALMLTGGRALERFAVARARRELTALLDRAPSVAHRRDASGVVTIEVAAVKPADVLVIKPGEVVAADGVLITNRAVLDEAALSGESKPVELTSGAPVRSGATNVGDAFELRVTAAAAQSTYAGIVRLVHAAEESKAPFVRLADRFALGFLGMTLCLAAAAWGWSGDPVRALAVLVVATPCPLILAAPAAIIAGVSLAARHGIIVKGGGPLEALARVSVILLDKTGTLTSGRPRVVGVESFAELSPDTVVRLAASAEQLSLHPFAPAIIKEAARRGLELVFPSDGREEQGTGIRATVGSQRVAVGQLAWVAPDSLSSAAVRSVQLRTMVEGSSSVFVAVDDRLAGALILQDPIRADAARVVRALRRNGIARVEMVSGDHRDIAELVGDAIGVDRVFAERTPQQKIEVVKEVKATGVTAMVGDGINDAPALALADVGVAMGARGATAASEAADVVLTVDRLGGLLVAVQIARRTRTIALESAWVGIGLSVIAMGFAAAGYLSPVTGAILQEVIDGVVILNALRALRSPRGLSRRALPPSAMGSELAQAHRALAPHLDQLSALAGKLESLDPAVARGELQSVRALLDEQVLPHERSEQATAYPVLARLMSPEDPTGPLIQTHNEIQRRARLFSRLLEQLPAGGPGPDDLRELRRTLYGLHAILSMHFAQEDDLYSALSP